MKQKLAWGTDPLDEDSDDDGVNDQIDEFPLDKTESVDTDKDGKGNNEDIDDDNDGLSDEDELTSGTDPLSDDSDGDGVKDPDTPLPISASMDAQTMTAMAIPMIVMTPVLKQRCWLIQTMTMMGCLIQTKQS